MRRLALLCCGLCLFPLVSIFAHDDHENHDEKKPAAAVSAAKPSEAKPTTAKPTVAAPAPKVQAVQAAKPVADDLDVLTSELAGGPPKQMLLRYLKQIAKEAFAARKAEFEKLKTPEEISAYQKKLKAGLLERFGPLPQRTPLNAQVVSSMTGDRYRLERIIYESQPKHFVTAVLYLPISQRPPYPVVVMPCGHTPSGKTENKTAGVFLARSGIACLCYDPIGQGERYQFLDENGKPRFRPTTEHTLLGAGSIPLGRNTATYRLWDGIRSIDYVASRTDIDATRIGVSGCSGGGTLTSYLMAFDDRVACAAPSCYITSFERLLETLGPQDAEQNIFGAISLGFNHADFLVLRAPKPTLLLAGTHDFFDIEGTWDSFRQAKRIYTRMGYGERVSLVETDSKHGYPMLQREAMVSWMQRWLQGRDEPASEPAITPPENSELVCTKEGQVQQIAGARTVADLNVELNKSWIEKRQKIWDAKDLSGALAEVRKIVGVRALERVPTAKATRLGEMDGKGCRIEKLMLATEPGIVLPALRFVPERSSNRFCLYLDGDGKKSAAQKDGPIEKLVREGVTVLAVDLRGIGETGSGTGGHWGGDWNDFFVSFLVGKSLVGMRAEDILSCTKYLLDGNDGEMPAVDVVATGAAGVAALHAVSLEPKQFGKLTLRRVVPSWSDVVRHPDCPGQLVSTVHGALQVYDLPYLIYSLGENRVVVEEPLDVPALAKGNRGK